MVNYGIIYTLPFKSRKELSYTVEIQKENYEGRPLELTGGDSPFSIELNDEDFLYTPARFSTATIRVVGNDYLQSLYSIGYQQFRVNLKQDNKVVWTGFVKPELYTQDYTSTIFDLEIECMSALSTLEYLDYKQAGEEARVFVSLWDLLKKCITSSNGLYDSVYIPHVYASSESDYNTGVNVLQNMKVSEQDFFDEDDKPMKLKEVLEEICKLLNWTVCDWKGSLYFVDIDHIGEYYKYSPDLETKLGGISPNLLNVQKVGYSGNGHALDVLTGRNKVTVKTSNYCAGELVPDEKLDELDELRTIDNVSGDNKRACRRIFLSPQKWNMYLYDGDKTVTNNDLDNYKNTANSLEGAILMKYCPYNQNKDNNNKWVPDITDYSFTNAIQVRYPSKSHGTSIGRISKIMSFKGSSAIYSDGAIAISGSYKGIGDNELIPWEKSTALYRNEICCQIRIGDKYYGNLRGDSFYGFKWEKNPKNYVELWASSWNNDQSIDFVNIENRKTLSMPYSGLSGIIIPIKELLYGEFEFTLLSRLHEVTSGSQVPAIGMVIKDFKVVYQKEDGSAKEDDNSDRTYENVVNEKFINELDEIEFKISSYNNDGACYSKVMLGDNYLKDNLYSAIENKLVRPEEHLIRRIIKQYGATKNKLTLILLNDGSMTPITRLSDKNKPDKYFIVTGGTIDYGMDQFECIMIEV